MCVKKGSVRRLGCGCSWNGAAAVRLRGNIPDAPRADHLASIGIVSLVAFFGHAVFLVATVACKTNGAKLRTQRIAIFRVCVHEFFGFYL